MAYLRVGYQKKNEKGGAGAGLNTAVRLPAGPVEESTLLRCATDVKSSTWTDPPAFQLSRAAIEQATQRPDGECLSKKHSKTSPGFGYHYQTATVSGNTCRSSLPLIVELRVDRETYGSPIGGENAPVKTKH
uniref:AlNc14C60G4402 protein n=1 Tax=Albugo laibachii Nc14 TaxID=890382 RepID=F0WCL8_9STRA|nr:AlNc14C60G4402 [Albugo laibachii Nc14]|eukprot:CCA18939.1 AlNc14C60G4402 [Albugo laibachii Nc14]